jgi:hypothetical protein
METKYSYTDSIRMLNRFFNPTVRGAEQDLALSTCHLSLRDKIQMGVCRMLFTTIANGRLNLRFTEYRRDKKLCFCQTWLTEWLTFSTRIPKPVEHHFKIDIASSLFLNFTGRSCLSFTSRPRARFLKSSID